MLWEAAPGYCTSNVRGVPSVHFSTKSGVREAGIGTKRPIERVTSGTSVTRRSLQVWFPRDHVAAARERLRVADRFVRGFGPA
jgi:hypothetical protein